VLDDLTPPFVLDDAFVRRFLNSFRVEAGGDMVKAMRLAGFDGSDASAAKVAEDLMARPTVRVFLAMVSPKRFFYTTDDTLAEYAKVAFAPWGEFVTVKFTKTGEMVDARLDLADKLRALDKIAEYQGLVGQRRGKKLKNRKEMVELFVKQMQRVNPGSIEAIIPKTVKES
jgi:hypothetical protein